MGEVFRRLFWDVEIEIKYIHFQNNRQPIGPSSKGFEVMGSQQQDGSYKFERNDSLAKKF